MGESYLTDVVSEITTAAEHGAFLFVEETAVVDLTTALDAENSLNAFTNVTDDTMAIATQCRLKSKTGIR